MTDGSQALRRAFFFLLNLKLIWFGSVSLTARCLPCLDFAYCVGMFPAAAARLFWTISDKGLSGQDKQSDTETHHTHAGGGRKL